MHASTHHNSHEPRAITAGDGQKFPISPAALAASASDIEDNGIMSGIVFTMRSEPGRVTCPGQA